MKEFTPKQRRLVRRLIESAKNEEQALRGALAKSRVASYVFQHAFGPFCLDFAAAGYRLAIEVDGFYHSEDPEYEERRTSYLKARRWVIIRFANHEVRDNLRGVVRAIEEATLALMHGMPLADPHIVVAPVDVRDGKQQTLDAFNQGAA